MKLMLIDGNSILNRAYYGIRPLSAPDGTPTNAVYGFLSMYKRFCSEFKPDAAAVTFDLKAPTFRHIYYPLYKAQRKPMSDELAAQLPVIRQVLDYMNIQRLEIEGFEADDILGTVSLDCEKNGWETIIITGDRDSLQLVSKTTSVYLVKGNISKNENILYTPELFFDEYGFAPAGIIDLKALMGDASDNIPGVRGVGEKTAMGLVQRYGSLDSIYRELDNSDISEKVKNKLRDDNETAYVSYYLATIKRDIPISFKPEKSLINDNYSPELYDCFIKLGFSKFIEEWKLLPHVSQPDVVGDFGQEVIEADDSHFLYISQMLESEKYICVMSDNPDMELYIKGEQSFHICRTGCFMTYDSILDVIFNGSAKLVGHNVKALMRRLLELDLNVSGFIFDTALAAYLLDANSGNYDLSYISGKYLGHPSDGVNAVYELYGVLPGRLEEYGLSDLYHRVEMPLCEILASMEITGFNVSRSSIVEFGSFLDSEIEKMQKTIYTYSGYEFNINSTKQLGIFLFDELMLPFGKKTKTGWSTSSDVLDKLSAKHPVIDVIKNYRTYSKLKSNYVDGLLKQIDDDGRIRTSFQMTATSTGRLSSTDPNLQNIPVRTEVGARLREMFLPASGWSLIDADYSQIELRILASVSGDEGMISAFNSNADFHAATAANIFGVSLSEVTPKMRSSVKAVNFGIIYGMSAFSLSQDLHISVEEAKGYIESYYAKYPGVKLYLDASVENAREKGCARTIWGRVRDIPELKSSNFNLRSFGERIAYNMPIQGTAADIMKLAMINVYNRLKRENMKAHLLLQVHDELVLEAPENEVGRAMCILREEMENACSLPVKLAVEVKSGRNWAEAH